MAAASEGCVLPVERPALCPLAPPEDYVRLRASEPVSKVRCPTGIDAWLVTRYADVRALLADPGMSSRGAASVHILENARQRDDVPPGSIIQLDGEAHSRLRRKLIGELTVRRVEAMRPYLQKVVDQHLDAMLAGDRPADFVRQFATPVPSLVICELLGVPYADRANFQRWSSTITDGASESGSAQEAVDRLSGYLGDLFEASRRLPGDDLFGRLIERGEATGDPLAPEELVMLGLSLLVAGHETTANMLALSTLMLIKEPALQSRLLASPRHAAAAVEELLRYLSVVQFGVLRHATEDASVGGVVVKAGDWVIGALNSANHDDDVFDDAAKLQLARDTPRRHLAFGFGPHQCLGQQLARVELQTSLTSLFRRVPDLRLAVHREELVFKKTSLVHGLSALPVTWG